MNKIKKIFITGTDTNVGKTLISCLILHESSRLGYKTVGFKPISSGGKINSSKYSRNLDSILLKKYSSVKLDLKIINPFSFKQETSPHIASKISKNPIKIKTISKRLKEIQKNSNFIIIEGAGGWYTPISEKITVANLVKKENLPVLLIVPIKLGCINHAILTNQAILSFKIPFIGWIANEIKPFRKYRKSYINFLKNNISSEFLGYIPYSKKKNFYELKKFINFKKLL